jgi:magnesium chelatase family protein
MSCSHKEITISENLLHSSKEHHPLLCSHLKNEESFREPLAFLSYLVHNAYYTDEEVADHMLAMVRSCAIIGLEGALVEVEVDISNGMTAFAIVGLPDAAVNEAKDRVKVAIKNSGCLFPYKRITVNLAPADLRKEGLAYDLPIAVGLLLASGQLQPDEQIQEYLFLGELSLDGAVRHTNGILPMVALAREKHVKAVFVPATDAMEETLVDGVTVYPVETLAQLVAHLNGERSIEPYIRDPSILDNTRDVVYTHDMASVRGVVVVELFRTYSESTRTKDPWKPSV